MLTIRQIFELISVVTAFASGMLLYYGSLGVPWKSQSWDGETERERAIERRQKFMVWIGIPSAAISLASQLFVILVLSN
jgi:hypothetical protein